MKNTSYDKIKKYYLYILLCNDGSYYAGITHRFNERMKHHFSGVGASYTIEHPPISVVFSMSNRSTRWKVLEVESYVHNNYDVLIALVNKEQWAIDMIINLWLKKDKNS